MLQLRLYFAVGLRSILPAVGSPHRSSSKRPSSLNREFAALCVRIVLVSKEPSRNMVLLFQFFALVKVNARCPSMTC